MTSPLYGIPQVPPPNAPAAQPLTVGVTPGASSPFVFAQYVIVSGGTTAGVYVYAGTPGYGNPPVAWMSSGTEDPYGNPVTEGLGATEGLVQGSVIASQTITAEQIADATITAALIANGTITAQQIASATITGGNIADTTITASNIEDATITSTQIADATITGSNIADATITASNIEDATITGTQIAAGTITGSNIANATITGGNIADATITAPNIEDATITSTQIASGTITGSNIGTATITGANLANATITETQIADGTITTTVISNSAGITGTQIASGTVTGGNIAAETITGSNIAATTITGGNIAAETIEAGNIASGTITASQIEAGTVLAGAVNGTTITGATLVATGADGEVLAYAGSPALGNLIASIAGATGSDTPGNEWGPGITVQGTYQVSWKSGSTFEDASAFSSGYVTGSGTTAQMLCEWSGAQADTYTDRAGIFLLSSSEDGSDYTSGYLFTQDRSGNDSYPLQWSASGGAAVTGSVTAVAPGGTAGAAYTAETLHTISSLTDFSGDIYYRALADSDLIYVEFHMTATATVSAFTTIATMPSGSYYPAVTYFVQCGSYSAQSVYPMQITTAGLIQNVYEVPSGYEIIGTGVYHT